MPKDPAKIITLPAKRLRQKSSAISEITSQTIALIERMTKATLNWEEHRQHEVGVALAAIQINELKRAVIVREDFEDKGNKKFTAYINPTVTSSSGKPEVDYEGCLSVKDIYGLVPRFPKITVSALNIHGEKIVEEIEGFRARVLQHEIDHLNGILFIDHIKKFDVFFKLNQEGELEKLEHKDVSTSNILW